MLLNRRGFLQLGAAGAALGALHPLMRCPFFKRPLQACMMGDTPGKLLLIFLRGGQDGLNVIIPHGDNSYNDNMRPSLFIDPDDAFDLNGFASAHPSFEDVVDDVPEGDIAWIQRVGYDPAIFSRSHFDGQQYWENAYPGSYGDYGWVNKYIRNASDMTGVLLPAASVSTGLQVLFRGPEPLAHIQNLESYSLEDVGLSEKLVGAFPNGDSGKGLLGIYSKAGNSATYDAAVRAHGLALMSSLKAVSDLDPSSYVPSNGATYNNSKFQRDLKAAVMLLKLTDCRVIGIELDGFDTHTSQNGQLQSLLDQVAHAIRATYLDTRDTVWDELMVVTMSEFGRTSDENGSMGTDHGEASCMIVAGGAVNGGVYNCDSTTWGNGGVYTSPSGRYIGQKTDFRAVLAEIVDKHFGQPKILNDVIYDWDNLKNDGSEFDYLGFAAGT